MSEMQKVGIVVEAHHHEVGTAGQAEIDMQFAPLLEMSDRFMWYKYIVKNVAKNHAKTATFMPKPLFEPTSLISIRSRMAYRTHKK